MGRKQSSSILQGMCTNSRPLAVQFRWRIDDKKTKIEPSIVSSTCVSEDKIHAHEVWACLSNLIFKEHFYL